MGRKWGLTNMPKKMEMLTGRVYGRWTVLGLHSIRNENAFWDCVCECGVRKPVRGYHLKRGASKSCGCLHRELSSTHGMTKNRGGNTLLYRTYKAYDSMLRRMTPSAAAARNYYDRGITYVDPRWAESAQNFVDDMGLCPVGLSLDRIDNDKGYYKENCRWATRSEQATNKRTSVVTPEIFGEVKYLLTKESNLTEIGRKVGISRGLVAGIKYGRPEYCTRKEYIKAAQQRGA